MTIYYYGYINLKDLIAYYKIVEYCVTTAAVCHHLNRKNNRVQ